MSTEATFDDHVIATVHDKDGKDKSGKAINEYCLFGQCQECAKDTNCDEGEVCNGLGDPKLDQLLPESAVAAAGWGQARRRGLRMGTTQKRTEPRTASTVPSSRWWLSVRPSPLRCLVQRVRSN